MTITSTPVPLSDYQRANLRKLAAGLMTVPQGHFGMTNFMARGERNLGPTANPHICGTAACAVGWAPTLVEPAKRSDEDFNDYSYRVLIPQPSWNIDSLDRDMLLNQAWSWAFSGEWGEVGYGGEIVDNTAIGAAKRITWLLDIGVPDNADEQMSGEDDLCYLDIEVPAYVDGMDLGARP